MVLGEMDLLFTAKGDEVEAEGHLLGGEVEHECFLPGEVVGHVGGLAVALLAVVGEPTVERLVPVDLPELGLPESDD